MSRHTISYLGYRAEVKEMTDLTNGAKIFVADMVDFHTRKRFMAEDVDSLWEKFTEFVDHDSQGEEE